MTKEKHIEIQVIGDLNWMQLKNLIVKRLNECTSHDEFAKEIYYITQSIGTINTIQLTRKKLGLKKLTREEIKEAEILSHC